MISILFRRGSIAALLLACLFAIARADVNNPSTVQSVVGGSVNSVATGACLTGGTITVSGTIAGSSPVNAQTGTTYSVANTDQCKLVTLSNAAPVAVTLPQAGSGGQYLAGWQACFSDLGAGTATITPTTSTIDGAPSLALTTNQGACVYSDGSNFFSVRGIGGSITYPLTAPNGTSAAPSYSFTNGTGSGLYAPSNGAVTLLSGPSNALNITGGTASTSTGVGGSISITGGGGGITSGGGGNITIQTGALNNGGPAVTGGAITLTGPSTTGAGGPVSITAGNSSGSFSSGNLTLTAGSNIQAGTVGSAGSVILAPGTVTATGVGTPGSAKANAGSGSGTFHLGGLISAGLTATGNTADTAEDTLQTFSLPSSSLDIIGRCVRVTSWGTTANNADTKTAKVYFGSAQPISMTLTASIVGSWKFVMMVCKTGSSTQTITVDAYNGTSGNGVTLTSLSTTASQTDTAAIVIKTTGQAGAPNANDIVGAGQLVEFLS